jgi:hypothetical protein
VPELGDRMDIVFFLKYPDEFPPDDNGCCYVVITPALADAMPEKTGKRPYAPAWKRREKPAADLMGTDYLKRKWLFWRIAAVQFTQEWFFEPGKVNDRRACSGKIDTRRIAGSTPYLFPCIPGCDPSTNIVTGNTGNLLYAFRQHHAFGQLYKTGLDPFTAIFITHASTYDPPDLDNMTFAPVGTGCLAVENQHRCFVQCYIIVSMHGFLTTLNLHLLTPEFI